MKSNNSLIKVLSLLSLLLLSACNQQDKQQEMVQQSQVVAQRSFSSSAPSVQNFSDVAYGNGIYLAVGSNGTIYTSNNAQHWYEQSEVTKSNLNAVVFNKVRKLFYAVGDNGLVLSSADGVSWKIYQELLPSVRLNSIAVLANGNEVIGGDGGNIFELILGADSSKDKIISREFYSDKAVDLSSSVTALAVGNSYMLAGNAAGLSDTKANDLFETDNWKYHGKLSNEGIADISFDEYDDYFNTVLKNGYVGVLDAMTQDAEWPTPVCIAHKGGGQCLVNATATSISEYKGSHHILVVGGGNDDKHTFISDSRDSNTWNKIDISDTSKLNKIRCFGDSQNSQCLAVGDNKAIVIVTITNHILSLKKVNITAPAVTSFVPADGSTRVDLTPLMELGFNLPVKNVDNNSVVMYEDHVGGTKVALNTLKPSLTNDQYTFAPTHELKELTKYVLVIESSIVDYADMPIRAKSFSFTTGDFTAPQVVMVNPKDDNEHSISLAPNVELEFSKPVLNVAHNISLHQGSETGEVVAISEPTEQDDNGYVFHPSNDLKSLTKYCVVATDKIVDNYDNKLVPYSACFTTGDYIAPMVTMTTPANNAPDVNLYSTIDLKFSKPVINVTDATVVIHKDSENGAIVPTKKFVGIPGGTDYVITPSSLMHHSSYYVVLDSKITDDSATKNALQKTVFNFDTASQAILVDPLPPTAANGQFVMDIHVAVSEDVEIKLPDYFTSKSSKTVKCEVNKVCQLAVDVSDMNGYQLPLTAKIDLKGVTTQVEASAKIDVSDMPTMAVFSSRGNGVEICKVTDSGLSGCKTSQPRDAVGESVGEVFGSKISSSGRYIYLMTGLHGQSSMANGIYKCDIDKGSFLVANCKAQANTSGYNTRSMVLSPDRDYAYFNHMNCVNKVGTSCDSKGGRSIDRCNVSTIDESLSNCKAVTKIGFDEVIERMVISDSGRNIYVNTSTGVQVCGLYDTNGGLRDLISCKSAAEAKTTVPKLKWGMTMGLDNSVMYFLGDARKDIKEAMFSCTRNKDTYALSDCKSGMGGVTGLGGLTGLAFAKNYVLITDYTNGAYQCTLTSDKRSFASSSSCKKITGGPVQFKDLEAVDIFQ